MISTCQIQKQLILRTRGSKPAYMEQNPANFKSPEKKLVTPRTYEDYLNQFRLPEKVLQGKKVLDVGSGLSNFSKKSNEKFADGGTTVVALDPTYSFLDENMTNYENNLARANLEVKTLRASYQEASDAYHDLKQNPLKVAGSHQHLPFAPGTFDLALAHNSMLQFKDREITRKALQEVGDVLNEHGELRMLPGDLAYDHNKESFYVRTFEAPTPETRKEAADLGLMFGPDREMFSILQAYEQAGYTIYAAAKNPERGSGVARRIRILSGIPSIPVYTLIIRKDADIPQVEGRGALYKLSFKNSPDGFHVSSEKVELPEEDGQKN